ncbi:TRAP-type C4-dicarboxylate transport system periplasmic component [Vibrio variabilis]|uniref:TRAP-type C4-dicarboxylate transport system periplasmic component n=2 Tax=Vibrio TaxID=662 RepID=A0ABQ0JEV7_9VIBR|nr:TRAP-type C4-dicarboxylate transport system periplasmic component [Vibrio variabilis]
MRWNKKALTTFVTCALAASTSFAASAATTLKLSHNQDRNHPVHKSMQYMADEVKELTNGELRIRIY